MYPENITRHRLTSWSLGSRRRWTNNFQIRVKLELAPKALEIPGMKTFEVVQAIIH